MACFFVTILYLVFSPPDADRRRKRMVLFLSSRYKMAYTLQQIFILPVTNPHDASISIHAPVKGATQNRIYRPEPAY